MDNDQIAEAQAELNTRKRKCTGAMADKRLPIYMRKMPVQVVTPDGKTGFAEVQSFGNRFVKMKILTEDEYIEKLKG